LGILNNPNLNINQAKNNGIGGGTISLYLKGGIEGVVSGLGDLLQIQQKVYKRTKID
jgi:hypothetical protein